MTASNSTTDSGVRNPGGTAGHALDVDGQDDMPGVRPPLPGDGVADVNGGVHLPGVRVARGHAKRAAVPNSSWAWLRAVEGAGLPPRAINLARVLADAFRWNLDDPLYGLAWQGYKRLAKRMGVHPRTVKRGMAELKAAGLVRTVGCSRCDTLRGYRSPTGRHQCRGEGHTAVREAVLGPPQKVTAAEGDTTSEGDTSVTQTTKSSRAASGDVPTTAGRATGPSAYGGDAPGRHASAPAPDGPSANDASDAGSGLSAGAEALAGIDGISPAEAAELVEQYGDKRVARVAREAQRRRPRPATFPGWINAALAQGWDAGWADDSEQEECAEPCPLCEACICVCVCEVCGREGSHEDVERAVECERERRRRNREGHAARLGNSGPPRAPSPETAEALVCDENGGQAQMYAARLCETHYLDRSSSQEPDLLPF